MKTGSEHAVLASPRHASSAAPRELVLASAGSGKTYHISSRLIAILAAGCPADQIFASTFTRKAAGEILDRVLQRLAKAALHDGAASELALALLEGNDERTPDPAAAVAFGPEATADAPAGAFNRSFWTGVLERLIRELHRLNIGTLDAFFIRAARSFSHELALPPAWTIADETTHARIRSDALQEVLRKTEPRELIELVRLLNRGAVSRSVYDALLGLVDELLGIGHEADPLAGDPWSAFEQRVPNALDGGPRRPPTQEEVAALAERLDALPLPRTGNGTPNAGWASALAAAAAAVRARDWEALLGGALCRRVVAASQTRKASAPPTYYRTPIDEPHRGLLLEAAAMARAALAPEIARQAAAMRRFAGLIAAVVGRRQHEAAAYRFDDVTRLLGGPDPVGRRPDLWYRLDARARHILLDEFQDTSLAQWEAVEPLIDELMSGYEGERAAVIVADPKQCIYGWRGAEPRVVHRLAELYTLRRRHFAGSWRSSQVVLDLVNRTFEGIAQNEMFENDQPCAAAAAEWAEAFRPHQAHKELPGHVRVVVGPADASRPSVRPNLCRHAAELIASLQRQAPGFSIGVLTRQNKVVARLIHELRELGVHTSEEGGNPLTDSAAALAVLALLRLADHPGDAIARYHVAMTPLGAALGLTDPADARAGRRLAHRVRHQLLDDGYGATLAALARRIEHECDHRQRRRLHQLVEAGFRHDARATLRPGDFIRIVESERVEDPTGADVRVMTVHQAKGLEFDVVVLPELDADIFRGGGRAALVRRDPESRRITEAYPYIPASIRCAFPEVHPAADEARQAVMRDALSGLYVAITRARHAVHVVLRPDGKSASKAMTPARILRGALAPGEPAYAGRVLYEAGDADWHRRWRRARAAEAADTIAGTTPVTAAIAATRPVAVHLRSAQRRTRVLPRRTPSDLAGADRVDLRYLLRLDTAPVMERGSVAHAWFQEIEWLDDGLPAEERLREIATREGPGLSDADVAELMTEFRAWVAVPEIAATLRRDSCAPGSRAERETPFVFRDGDALVEGIIDRLVLEPGHDGTISSATVIDFKTDGVGSEATEALDERTEYYRPQMEAYRRAVARRYRLAPERVAARLVFVRAGVVRSV